jgi:hypothetical protein
VDLVAAPTAKTRFFHCEDVKSTTVWVVHSFLDFAAASTAYQFRKGIIVISTEGTNLHYYASRNSHSQSLNDCEAEILIIETEFLALYA